MGEVYRARDSKLGRDVALKVLPEQVAEDRDRLSRFTREAQLLASLNHPNIAAIYGVEEAGGSFALVLEYVDGETLEERISKGPIPIADVLRFALQIARALEAAHEKSVIHRDLKPANVKITPEGVIKVLDFGLAKAMENEQGISQRLSQSPTISMAATNAGVILGTAGYMAPEQARGLPVDRRADIWAFGVLLIEMLTARRVFEGNTVADTFAKLLEREPNWDHLPPQTPVALRGLLHRCLKKNSKDRLQAIGDARTLLEELISDPAAQAKVEVTPYPLWKKILPWAIAAALLAAGLMLRAPARNADRVVSHFDQPLPANTLLAHNYRRGAELSPDGQKMVFTAAPADQISRLYIRNINRWDTVLIAGTEDADTPFFSPDGQSIGYQQGQQIKTVSLAGGEPKRVVEHLDNPGPGWGPPGISWGKNGKIVFSHSLGVGLSIVSETGGEAVPLTTLDTARNEASHRLPHFLPDGSAVLFTVLRFSTISPDWRRAEVWVKPMSGERKLVIENAMDARYVGNNTLVFARQAKLFAVHFDPKTLKTSGNPVQVLENVTQALYGSAAVTWTGAAQFSVAENGTLLYAYGSIEPPLYSNLVWYDRDGKNRSPVMGMTPRFRFVGRILPDGKRIAFSDLHLKKDIWIFDPDRGGNEDPASFEGQNAFPIFSPDGSWMAFRSDRSGPLAIYVANTSNMREVKQVTPGPFDVPSSWTRDAKELAFTRGFTATGGNTDIYVVSVDDPKSLRPLVATDAAESFPEFSPDGKWIAYTSRAGERSALIVQPYPGSGHSVTIASGIGNQGQPTEPAWSRVRNSNELFYRLGTNMMSVKFTVSGSEFIPGKPEKLFQEISLGTGTTVRATYDVAPDGRFLLNQADDTLNKDRLRTIFPPTLRVILNWDVELRRLLDAEH
jgi:serine/threonine-protein kinase